MAFVKPTFPLLRRSHPLARDLAPAWLMAPESSSVLRDYSGSGYHGTIASAVGQGAAPDGWALTFFGSSAISVSNAVPLSAPFTIAFRLRPDSGNSYGNIGTDSSGNWGWWFVGSSSTNKISLFSGTDHFNNTALTLGTWYDYAATYDGTTFQFYLNGTSDGSAAFSFNHSLGSIGNDQGTGSALEALRGALAYFYVWNRVLLPSEISGIPKDPYAMFRPRPLVPGLIRVSSAAPAGKLVLTNQAVKRASYW